MTKWRHGIIGLALVSVGALLGALGSNAVQAQGDMAALQPLPPLVIGETITVRYRGYGGDACDVAEIRGYFVRCQKAEENRSDDNWYNLMVVERIVRRRR